MFARFKAPVLALALGLVPFLAFIGTSSTVSINGEVVRNEQFNLLGLACAIIGLGIVFTALRPSAPPPRGICLASFSPGWQVQSVCSSLPPRCLWSARRTGSHRVPVCPNSPMTA